MKQECPEEILAPVPAGQDEEQDQEKMDSQSPYIVGIGASAGGLEALQDFFKALPTDTGAGFVVIQHLSPDYKSLMSELLSRCTKMEVNVAEDGQLVEKDRVYLIPPGKALSIFHSRLYLNTPHNARGVNLAIDTFFRSLAADQGNHAVAIVLSGAGSDGTLGIRAIKEAGGMIMAQDSATAKFNSMPRNSIATGLVDYILAPAKMGEALVNYLKHPYVSKHGLTSDDMKTQGDSLSKILEALRNFSNIDFFSYKENTIIRRLERRVSVNRFLSLDDYLPFFMESEEEKNILFRELLIGVTSFFRDKAAFDTISHEVLPHLRPAGRVVRIWSVACSTGEEVYSLAMLLAEYIQENKLNWEVKIFATDIDRDALNSAAQGFYPDSLVSDIAPDLLAKYFIKREGGYQICADIRRMLVFSVHNILRDPPFSKLDLLICRNLFIYLKPHVQQELLSVFYYTLNPGGYLFMGSSESVGEMGEAFDIVNSRWKIYRRKEDYHPGMPGAIRVTAKLPSFHTANRVLKEGVRMEHIIESAFSTAMPPCVVIDAANSIVHMNHISDILVYRTGEFTPNLFANLPDDLGLFVNGVLRRLKTGDETSVSVRATGLNGFGRDELYITGYGFTVRQMRYYLLTFQRQAPGETAALEGASIDENSERNQRIRELEQELTFSKESLQATVEELETSNEELQSSNEELVASNEELQSTNEELQSVNEELYTVNSEYQSKIGELLRLNTDLDNLLKNTGVGAIYLDSKLCIRKITPMISEITNIMTLDVGRPLVHISLMDGYNNYYEDIQFVQETLKPVDREFTDSRDRSWLISIRPYRTEYNSVDGIIITFVEITTLHHMEHRVAQLILSDEEYLPAAEGVIELFFNSRDYLLRAEQGAAALFGLPEEKVCGKDWNTLIKKLETAEGEPLPDSLQPLNILKSHQTLNMTEYRMTTGQGVIPICIGGKALFSKDGVYEGAAIQFQKR